MFVVGYNTPYRIVLLLLIRRYCKFEYPPELMTVFTAILTSNVLNEDRCKKTCSEPSLNDLDAQIMSSIEDPDLQSSVEQAILGDLEEIMELNRFDQFMCSLGGLLQSENELDENIARVNKLSVLGLFVRRCRISYEQLAATNLSDIHGAFMEYVANRRGDSELTDAKDERATGWVSDHNVKEFIKYQAEQIEITGTTNISESDLHRFLDKVETHLPSSINLHQLRYLNYTRSKEYKQSLFYSYLWSSTSLDKGVGIQYAHLTAGILEYKFGHFVDALQYLDDALTAARSNKDEFCLQEVQYWIELCRKEQPVNDYSSYTDPQLKTLKTLSKTRNMVRDGYPCRNVFENLYKSSISITTNDIKFVDRVQNLITSLAWKRYGDNVMASSYLDLAQHFGGESIEEIQNTVIAKAYQALELGDSKKAFEDIQAFIDVYSHEKDVLRQWHQAKDRISKQSCRKRTHESGEFEAYLMQFATPTNSEEYFNAVYDHARNLILKGEIVDAIRVLANVYDFIQKTHQMSQLSQNYTLQATALLYTGSAQEAIPILIEAMKLAKKYQDSENYYSAIMKLCEAYVCVACSTSLEKAINLLENIFPKVLLTGSKLQEADLHLTYAAALHATSLDKETEETALEYVLDAEQADKQSSLEHNLMKALYYKAIIQNELGLQVDKRKTINEIKELKK